MAKNKAKKVTKPKLSRRWFAKKKTKEKRA